MISNQITKTNKLKMEIINNWKEISKYTGGDNSTNRCIHEAKILSHHMKLLDNNLNTHSLGTYYVDVYVGYSDEKHYKLRVSIPPEANSDKNHPCCAEITLFCNDNILDKATRQYCPSDFKILNKDEWGYGNVRRFNGGRISDLDAINWIISERDRVMSLI